MKPLTKQIYRLLQSKGFIGSYILQITKSSNIISVRLELPINKEINELLELLPNMQQELKASDCRVAETSGKRITIEFATSNLQEISFTPKFLTPNTLKLKLPTPFGFYTLDFADGASCHMLNGGAPRMGKTIFLLYLSTILYKQTNGFIKLYITSPKSKDFYPLFDLPNTTISSDEKELTETLFELVTEYKARNTLLYSPEFKKATDAKSIKEFYPQHYHLFQPIFLIIDEYARFSDIKPIQKLVAELVQTAGYVNIHIVIATQRPDARNTFPANIKMGLMCRICFRTADENNSIVILDQKGAETLPNIKGRALLKDGDIHTVQIPYITYEQCEDLLNPYKRSVPHDNQTTHIKEEERQTNTELTNKIQSLFSESIVLPGIPEQHEPNQRLQPNDETANNGWFRLANQTTKG
jgi:DNA segregation ATPase FtsK/SpoIIIE-like protein